jgi:hypothetical protein
MAIQPDFKKLSVFPNIVNVNVLKGECPCSCVHCPVGIVKPEQRARHFGKQTMALDLFKQITVEIAQHKQAAIRIHSVGEPLLWKELDAAVRFLNQHHVQSWIFTCAITNDHRILRSICEHVSIIEVSVNATNHEEYLATKGVNAFDLVTANINYMSEYIKTNRLPTMLLLSRVQTGDENSDRQFTEYWTEKKLADDVFIRSYHNYNNLLDARDASYLKKPCLVHWARASIDCDGTMVCCFNELFKPYTQDIILGKIDKTTSIQQIWQGKKLQRIRKCDNSGNFSGLGFKIPCETCKACQPIDTSRDTSEKQLLASTNKQGIHE